MYSAVGRKEMIIRRLISMALLAGITTTCLAQENYNPAEVAKKATASVLLIKGISEQGETIGTGFLISSDGKIVTALHVILSLKSGGIRLSHGEIFESFSVLAFDERRDLAIIKIPGFDLPSIELGNSNDVSPGDQVLLIGNPKGLQGTITAGIVSAIRDLPEGFKVIQTDAAANPGNSGGPLFNLRGQVIGVLNFKLRGAENLNFALPINYVRGMMSSAQNPMSLDEMRAKLSGGTDVFKSGGYPTKWKSLTTGTVRILRFEGEYIYIETLLKEEEQKLGFFFLAEVKKQGDKYVGTMRQRVVSWQTSTLTGEKIVTKSCTLEWPYELTYISPTRMEARGLLPPNDAKLDFKKCTFNKKPEWQRFVWIPE